MHGCRSGDRIILIMVSEEDANTAREQYADDLTDLGAHAIGVDEINIKGKKTFAVIMYTEELNKKIPEFLVINKGNEQLNVPLKIQLSETFKPE